MELSLVTPAILALILYWNTLDADFAYDDSRAIQKNPDLLPETPIINLFYDDFWGTPLTHSGSHKSYRPLCVLTFRLTHLIWGMNPRWFHLGNVILHAITTTVFTYITRLLTNRRFSATVAGLLFAAHPIHTEAVAGIVGRADIMACLFFLLAFHCYIKYCKFRDLVSTDMSSSVFDNQYGKNSKLKTGHVRTSSSSGYSSGRTHSSNLSPDTRTCSTPSWRTYSSSSVNTSSSSSRRISSTSSTGSESVFQTTGDDRTKKWIYICGTFVFTAASMLSKEQGLAVLAVCGTYDLFVHQRLKIQEVLCSLFQRSRRHLWEGMSILLVMVVLLLGFRITFMGNKPPEFAPADNPASDSPSLLTRTLTFYHLPVLNFWLLLYPRTLSFDWSMEAVPLIESLSDLRNLLTLTFYSILAFVIGFIISSHSKELTVHVFNGNGHSVNLDVKFKSQKCRHKRRGSTSSTESSDSDNQSESSCVLYNHSVSLLILSLAILIFPFLAATNLFFYVGFVIAERVLYIPSMGFCLLVAHGADLIHRKLCERPALRTALVCVVVVGIATFGLRTVVRNRDWQNEESLYRSGLAVNPAKAWGNLANILNSQGKTSQAEEAYRAALRYRGNMADVHYNLGILLQEQKRYSEAVESYKMAIKCRPRLTMAHLNLGIVYTTIGKKPEAEKIFRRCSEIDISGLKDPRVHESAKISALYNLGRLLADEERVDEAIQVYKEAVNRRPSHYAPQSLYNMLGEAYSKQGELSEAEHWYLQALKAKPDHIPAHLTMAKLLHNRNQLREAESWYLKAKRLRTAESSVYQHYGQFLVDIGHYAEAAENYMEAVDRNPNDFELIFNAAGSLRQAGRITDAEAFYRKAARLRPDVAAAHMNLGAMLHFNGKLEEAEQSYLMALHLQPNDAVTQTNLRKLRNLLSKKGTRTTGSDSRDNK